LFSERLEDIKFSLAFSTHKSNFLISIQIKTRGRSQTLVRTENLPQIHSGISKVLNHSLLFSFLKFEFSQAITTK
jgi:hypothetical protein